jgi:pyridoxamine 5'-phosphate oxidase
MGMLPSLRALLTAGRGAVQGLPDISGTENPFELFSQWFAAAQKSGLYLPEAMALATAGSTGEPSVRMVLMKGHSPEGITFYTNYSSLKSRQLEENPRASVVFHWPILQRQVRFAGSVDRLSTAESDAYFRTRSRGSRIGAWASHQSRRLARRSDLQARVRDFEKKFAGEPIPLPPFWGGYLLIPERIEFWQGRLDRLHDRIAFERSGNDWISHRLYP